LFTLFRFRSKNNPPFTLRFSRNIVPDDGALHQVEDLATKDRRHRDRDEPQQIRARFHVPRPRLDPPHLVRLHIAETDQRTRILFGKSVDQQLDFFHYCTDNRHLEQSKHSQVCKASNAIENPKNLQESFEQDFSGSFTHRATLIVGNKYLSN
jgi:hypothetical protein